MLRPWLRSSDTATTVGGSLVGGRGDPSGFDVVARAAAVARGLRALAAVLVAVSAVASLTGVEQGVLPASANHWLGGLILLLCAVLCLLRAWLVDGERSTWIAVGSGLLSWAAGELLFAVGPTASGKGPLSIANLLSLAFYPAVCAAVALLIRGRVPTFITTLWLDGLAGTLAVSALAAGFVFPPVLANLTGNSAAIIGDLSYPLADLIVIGFVLFALAMTGWRPGPLLGAVAAAVALIAITDGLSLWWAATGHATVRTGWDWLWSVGALALAEVAWRSSPPSSLEQSSSLRLLVFPLIASLLALGVLFSGAVSELDAAGYELATSALVLIVVRLAFTVLENLQIAHRSRRQAVTDALTGLRNRRGLMYDLERALNPDATPSVLILFDLDGFKNYNDTFGHPAGDRLLARLGIALQESVPPGATAYRLGGDEFCILAPANERELIQLLTAASTALSERGSGFSVTSSYGSVVVPAEAADIAAALQLADQRLYKDKGTRRRERDSVHARDILRQLLREKQPALDQHLGGVAALARTVGQRLGLSPEQIDQLTRAAELHDVGKMAIPDAILEKPAKLNEQEMDLIRQHTLIGQRILEAAPALRPVGELVRFSHERYDGRGYPDGLRGEEIPLGARIIAVCDAYDAMTSERSYRSALSAEQALDELRACAGAQFDPAIVEVFCQAAAASRNATAAR